MDLLWGSPVWVIPLCLLLGLVYAWAMHGYKPLPGIGLRYTVLLWALRTLTVALVALLCLEPQWQRTVREVQPPLVVVAVDLSKSMSHSGLQAKYLRELALKIQDKCKGRFRLEWVGFGQRAQALNLRDSSSFAFRQSVTNTEPLNQWTQEHLGNAPLAAWILVSDGHFNQGRHPAELFGQGQVPCYTVAWGKEGAFARYWNLGQPTYPRRVPAQSQFEVEIPLEGIWSSGHPLELTCTVQSPGTDQAQVQTLQVRPGSGAFRQTLRWRPSVGEPGIYTMKIRGICNPCPPGADQSKSNIQEKTFYVESIKTQQHVRILGLAPHPDIGVLRHVLEQSQTYRVTVAYGLKGLQDAATADDADLYCLHQWPALGADPLANKYLDQLEARGKAQWWLGGPRSDWTLWPYAKLVPRINPTPVLARPNPVWNAFTLGPSQMQGLTKVPPLTVWTQSPTTLPASQVVLYQQWGGLQTQRPLWTVDYQSGSPRAYLWAEGLWRWRLSPQAPEAENASGPLPHLVLQTAALLLGGREQESFEVHPVQSVFHEHETVLLEGSSRNAEGSFDNQAPVRLDLMSGSRVLYQGPMEPSGLGYSFSAGWLPPGTYQYLATATRNGLPCRSRGTFGVSSYDLELRLGGSQRALLESLSRPQKALFRTVSSTDPGHLETVAEDLLQHMTKHPNLKPSSAQVVVTTDWLTWEVIWWLLGLLLALEWLIFKALGGQ